MKIAFRVMLIGLMAIFLVSCGSYYKVTEPSSDKVYYTKKIKSKKQGAVVFTDETSGSDVTLQNSEVTKIDKKEFKAATVQPKQE